MSVLSSPHFHDEAKAFEFLESIVWANGVVCPHCGVVDGRVYALDGVVHNTRKGERAGNVRFGLKKCGECRKQFTVKVGTVFEHARIPLHKMLQAVHLIISSKKGISSHQLSRILEVQYKSAWFLAHRIREAMRSSDLSMFGTSGGRVEVDETYYGNKAGVVKEPRKSGSAHKMRIVSLIDRDTGAARSMVHRAAPGMLPSAIERSDGLDADDVQLSAALTSDAFSDADLLAGRWDGAGLTLSAVDWTAPDVGPVTLLTGEFGEVEIRDGGFAVGLRGATSVLDAAAVEATSPECRAQLGDLRCRVDLSGRRVSAGVVSVSESVVTLSGVLADGDFAYGSLRWLDGANAGLESRVVANAGAGATLRDVPAFAVTAGTRIELVEGCDKRFATCVSRFGNAVNFRGEPHLPGNDLLTRYGD